jgi:putative endonuclease
MAKKHNLIVGRLGENIAKNYLKKNGYEIIEQNYRTKYAEIDLIAKYKKLLVFIEVRTKIGENFGSPEDTLNKKKIDKFVKNCFAYIYCKKQGQNYRIDAICIVINKAKGIEKINHYKDIIF